MNTRIKLTYLTSAMLMLAACTQEDHIPGGKYDNGERIVFRTSLPEVSSRASIASIDNIKEIHVTAFNPYDSDWKDPNGNLLEYVKNDVLKYVEEGKYYVSENCIWPERGHENDTLSFFAYYPSLNEGATIVNASTVNGNVANFDYKIKNYKIASNIGEQVDFITAYTTGSMENDMFSGISLKFQHKLSRIEVKAKSSNKSCKIQIAGVRIGGICREGTYNFKAEEDAGDWTLSNKKDSVEYIFGPKDKIVALDNTTDPVSIMGGSNYAMLLPSTYTGWDFANDHTNSSKEMYISVLLRVLDKTPGGNDKQQYPYFDNSQGLNAMNIPRVYLAVAKTTGIVSKRLYKSGNSYYTDKDCTKSYTLASGEEVREFGWAALPVTGDWKAGYAYTYTLDYTYGVGLHDPSVEDPQSGLDSAFPGPMAGDPIISDRVGVTVTVKDWQGGEKTTHGVDVPGS